MVSGRPPPRLSGWSRGSSPEGRASPLSSNEPGLHPGKRGGGLSLVPFSGLVTTPGSTPASGVGAREGDTRTEPRYESPSRGASLAHLFPEPLLPLLQVRRPQATDDVELAPRLLFPALLQQKADPRLPPRH